MMPDKLTWFKWEAYATWLSGFMLVVIVYYLDADLFLVDKSVLDLTATQAALFSLVSLVLAWLLYEGACRSRIAEHELTFVIGGYVFLVGLTYAFTDVLSGRGAFNQIGAIIGTIMVANVFLVIIPNQKKTVAALLAGATPDPELGKTGKQRSVHNNYLTCLGSGHSPFLQFASRRPRIALVGMGRRRCRNGGNRVLIRGGSARHQPRRGVGGEFRSGRTDRQ